jgi:hypothetical protein
MHDPDPGIAPQFIGAEPVRRRRSMHALCERNLIKFVGKKVRTGDHQKQKKNKEKESYIGDAVLFKAPPNDAPVPYRERGRLHRVNFDSECVDQASRKECRPID